MSKAKERKGNVWCAGCLTDYMLAGGKNRARRILIRVVQRDYRVKQGLCRGCGRTRKTIDLTRRKGHRPKAPPAA